MPYMKEQIIEIKTNFLDKVNDEFNFNFGDSIEFSNNLELWYDAVHLNSDGAALFTEMLMKQITDYKTGQQSVEHTSDIL